MLLHDAFDFQAHSRGDYCFAQCEGKSLTYTQAQERSRALASMFLQAGLGKGDRIGILKRNSLDSLLLIYAASRVGVVPVPLNYRLAPVEWVDLLQDADAKLVILDPDYQERFDQAYAELSERPDIVRVSTGAASGPWLSMEKLIGQAPADLPDVAISQEDIVLQMYTSGTTGRAKGALLSHRAMVENLAQSIYAAPYKINPGERSLIALPLFHIAAISTSFAAATLGACLIIHRDVDPMAIVKALAEEEIVVASMVPAVMQFILAGVPGIDTMHFPHLKFLGYGASPISEPVLRKAMAVFKCHFAQGYGMTEAAGSATMLTETDHQKAMAGRPELLLSAGKPLPGTQVRVLGADGADAALGEVGEVLIRGGQLMSGYWKLPQVSAETLKDGWLHTGDAGCLDEEGYLYIRDRVKDMIVSGAENIYPIEIELVLFDHPAVADVSVIGVPDVKWGEAVTAVIVVKADQQVTFEELDIFCRKRLGGFKVPKRYEFSEGLPRNASGKVLKKDLRQHYWQGHDRQIA